MGFMKAIFLGILSLLPLLGVAHDLTVPLDDDPDREALRAHILSDWHQYQAQPLAKSATASAPTFSRSPHHTLQVASSSHVLALAAQAIAAEAMIPETAKAFLPFKKLDLREEGGFLYIGSDGLPEHGMMVGITAWQQQVPLPQSYWGDNTWRLPLHPRPAAQPALVKDRFLRGAIALAANGIPIFNPQNNRGEISQEIGELDQWGGHCGRADDYHYHVVPLHLQARVGKGLPVAYALDGYPIYGLTEPDGSSVSGLDECHGHESITLGYHYHASLKYPYVIGGFHGEVTEAEGQVDPQPRAHPVRPALQALRGAKITGFEKQGPQGYQLRYEVNGDPRSITYQINADGTYPFRFNNGREGMVEETYSALTTGSGGREPKRDADRKRMPEEGRRRSEPKNDEPPRKDSQPSATSPRAILNRIESQADANGDGLISAAEYAAHVRRAASQKGLSVDSALQAARQVFADQDTNQNGQLESAEWQSEPSPTLETESKEKRRPTRSQVANESPSPATRSSDGRFLLSSPAVADAAELPAEHTGDGAGISPALTWENPPEHTQSYALIMDHQDRDGNMKWYWTVYNIPASARSLPKDNREIGSTGTGFKGAVGYEPPHSKGAGAHTYVITLYALDSPLVISGTPGRVELLNAMQGKILASSSLHVVHTSLGAGGETSRRDRPSQPPTSDRGDKPSPRGGFSGLIKPTLTDTMKLNVYADNWFMLYINGRLTAVDSIPFTPHNVVSVDVLPEYPMTIAVLAKDNADPKTGLEYGSSIGDGGFILKFGDGTVTNATWKAKSFFHGPLKRDANHPQVIQEPLPDHWWQVDFDDSAWKSAQEYSLEAVDPKQPYYDHDFEGAKFIWTEDLALDNTVIFRTRVEKPGWQPRWNTRPDLDVTEAPMR